MERDEGPERLARVERMLAWLRANGAEFPKVCLGSFREGPGGAVAPGSGGIAAGEVAIRVPLALGLSVPRVRREWPQLAAFEGPEVGADKWALVYLYLAAHRRVEDPAECFFAPFIQAEPRVVGTPVTFAEEELREVRGTNLHEAVQGIRGRLRALEAYVPELARAHAELAGVLGRVRYEDLLWAYECFWSRAYAARVRGEDVAVLLPLCGMLNHSAGAKVTYVTAEPCEASGEGGWFALRCEERVGEGEQLYANYRHRSNEKLLLNYGFVDEGNVLDAFAVKLSLSRDDPLHAAKVRALAACGIAQEHYLSASTGPDAVPDTLLDALRVLCLDDAEAYFFRPAPAGSHGPVGPRNELDALRNLARLLAAHLARQLFANVEADDALLADTAHPLPARLRSIVVYRAGQARILRHCARVAAARFADYAATLPRDFSYLPPTVPAGGPRALAAFNAVAEAAGVFRGVRYEVEPRSGGTLLVATRDIAVGETVVRFPKASLVTATTITAAGGALSRAVASGAVEDFEEMAALYLHEHAGDEGLRGFFEALPACAGLSTLWGEEALALVEGTRLHTETLEARDDLRKSRARLHKRLVRCGHTGAKAKMVPLERFAHLRAVAAQRTVETDEGEEAMMPLPLLPRHSPYDRLRREFDAEGALLLNAERALHAGEEVRDTVGTDQSEEHCAFWGFLMHHNPCDVVCLGAIGVEAASDEDDALADCRRQALRGLGQGPAEEPGAEGGAEHLLRPDGEIGQALLDTLRVSLMGPDALRACIATGLTTPENDRAVGEALCQVLQGLLDKLKAPPQEPPSAEGGAQAAALYLRRQREIIGATLARAQQLGR